MVGKLDEYRTIPSLNHLVLVDPDVPRAFHGSRPPRGAWVRALLEGLGAVIRLPEIVGAIDLATMYSGLVFKPSPRLVHGAESAGWPHRRCPPASAVAR